MASRGVGAIAQCRGYNMLSQHRCGIGYYNIKDVMLY